MAKREATIYGFPTRRYPRNDGVVGMMFHRYDQRGTPTYINAVIELGGDMSLDELTRVVDEKLLRRFPRWRGHVSPHDEQHWVVPESVDPASYIEEVPFVHGDFRAAIIEHVSSRFRDPLPDGCSPFVTIETCVENPVVAPQSRWKMMALCKPSGASALLICVFEQVSEQPPSAIPIAARMPYRNIVSTLIYADQSSMAGFNPLADQIKRAARVTPSRPFCVALIR